jgi:hypothetical protein
MAGMLQHMGQHAAQQVLCALAHHVFDRGGRQRGQLQIGQHAGDGLGKVADGVHHGPVQVHDGGIHIHVERRNRDGNHEIESANSKGLMLAPKE